MRWPVSLFTVYGNSMEPTLHPGQKLVSFNWIFLWSKPHKGDLVAIKLTGRMMVKRIQKLHNREIFVVGDNLKMSTDSRKFGWIKSDKIFGKIIWINH